MDGRGIPKKTIQEAEGIIGNTPDSFDPVKIYNVSQAVGPIAEFCVSMVKLAKVCVKIQPLEQKMNLVTDKLKYSREELAKVEENLKLLTLR